MRERCSVLVVFGTRPEAIKMAPLVQALRARPDLFDVQTCATGQHRDMLDQVLRLFNIVPDYDLDLMQANQTPSRVAARVLDAMEPVLQARPWDWVLLQGDTTTVMATAIAAHHQRRRVGHVEAGLRTGDRMNPFPEEMNRIVADHLSDLCFAPTERARGNLLREGIDERTIYVTGNTVVDALLQVAAQPWSPPPDSPLVNLPPDRKLILVTAHRRESFGRPLENICLALREIATQCGEEVQIVYAVHPNPNVRGTVEPILGDVPGVWLVPPQDYLSLVHLMKRSYLILTDSGGLQEEAPSLGVPVLVMREVTERPEAVEAGVARIVGTDRERIVAETLRLLNSAAEREAMAHAINPYGDGHAAEHIVDALLAHS